MKIAAVSCLSENGWCGASIQPPPVSSSWPVPVPRARAEDRRRFRGGILYELAGLPYDRADSICIAALSYCGGRTLQMASIPQRPTLQRCKAEARHHCHTPPSDRSLDGIRHLSPGGPHAAFPSNGLDGLGRGSEQASRPTIGSVACLDEQHSIQVTHLRFQRATVICTLS